MAKNLAMTRRVLPRPLRLSRYSTPAVAFSISLSSTVHLRSFSCTHATAGNWRSRVRAHAGTCSAKIRKHTNMPDDTRSRVPAHMSLCLSHT
eukprot:426809-Pleurochrysis_carterae.AAC.2